MPGPSTNRRAWRRRIAALRALPAAAGRLQQEIDELRSTLDAVTAALAAQQQTTEALRRRWLALAQTAIGAPPESTDPRCAVVESPAAAPPTPYVAVAARDVRFNPAWFAAAADHLDRHPELAAVYGDAVELGEGYELWSSPPVLDEEALLAHDVVDLPAVVLRSTILPVSVPRGLARPDRWVLLTALRAGGIAALALPACAIPAAGRADDGETLRRLWAEAR